MQRRARRCAQCEAEKGRASQKQRSEFLAAPVHMAPPGRQKSERAFCLFGGVFLRPERRAVCPGWPLFRSLPLSGLLAFVPGAPAFFCRYAAALFPACGLSDSSALGLVCAAAACHALVRAFFLLSFAFFRLTFSSQKSFHLSLMPRRAPHFLFGKKMGEKNREGRCPFEPHSSALWPISPFPALLAGLRGLRPQTAG